jgi:hypothetical protein
MADVADTLVNMHDRYATAGVAAALAQIAGRAAADAACSAKLGALAPVDDLAALTEMLSTVEPHGREMARDLTRLHEQGPDQVSAARASDMVGFVRAMVETSRQVLAGTDSPIG